MDGNILGRKRSDYDDQAVESDVAAWRLKFVQKDKSVSAALTQPSYR